MRALNVIDKSIFLAWAQSNGDSPLVEIKSFVCLFQISLAVLECQMLRTWSCIRSLGVTRSQHHDLKCLPSFHLDWRQGTLYFYSRGFTSFKRFLAILFWFTMFFIMGLISKKWVQAERSVVNDSTKSKITSRICEGLMEEIRKVQISFSRNNSEEYHVDTQLGARDEIKAALLWDLIFKTTLVQDLYSEPRREAGKTSGSFSLFWIRMELNFTERKNQGDVDHLSKNTKSFGLVGWVCKVISPLTKLGFIKKYLMKYRLPMSAFWLGCSLEAQVMGFYR